MENMNRTASDVPFQQPATGAEPMNPGASGVAPRPRLQFLRVLAGQIEASGIPLDQRVLIVGGSADDERLLRQVGFKDIVNSNLPTDMDRMVADASVPGTQHIALDVEQMELPDDSFDLVFASEVLHHCRSPHHALCEMLRVCRRYVVFMEPNDSLAMAALVRMKFSFPYELPAVVAHDYRSGGLRDSQIPNFIYRWNGHEVLKTVSACIPERTFSVHAYPYWDFEVTKKDLDLRKATRLGSITSVMGAANFISLLRFAQFFLNWIRPLRGQGNKFLCCIEKSADLKPWMAHDGAEIVFNREFGQQK
ncbi:MAG: methyltransferase domain-containing protein [Candidatus Sulfotelmatobacter sp.]